MGHISLLWFVVTVSLLAPFPAVLYTGLVYTTSCDLEQFFISVMTVKQVTKMRRQITYIAYIGLHTLQCTER